jgi:signal transduction histidine kinase
MALDNQNQSLVFILMGIIRTYFLVLGLYLLIMTLRKKINLLLPDCSGAVVLIIFAIISTLVEFYFLNGHSVMIRGLSWLLIGFFIEVIFYSAAVGYRTKKENIQRVDALQKIVDQYDIIKQHDIDKLKAMYQSKEEERNRIVKDIHDEIGSTVSSIYILSNVAIQDKDKKDNSPMLIEIRDNAATLSDKVDDIVWSMNPQHDYMESLLNRIRQFATPLFEAKEIDYDFRFDKELLYKKTEAQSRQYIYYIVKEAINNLIKYSDCKRQLLLQSIVKAAMNLK